MNYIRLCCVLFFLLLSSVAFSQDKQLTLNNEVYELEVGGKFIMAARRAINYVDLGDKGLIRFGGGFVRFLSNDLEVIWERKISEFGFNREVAVCASKDHIYLLSLEVEAKGLEPYNEYLKVIQLNMRGEIIKTSGTIFLGKSIDIYHVYVSGKELHYLYLKGGAKSKERNTCYFGTFSADDLSHSLTSWALPTTGIKVGDQAFRGNTLWKLAPNYSTDDTSGTWLYKYEYNWKDKKEKRKYTNHLLFVDNTGKRGEEIIIPQPISFFRYVPQLGQFLAINHHTDEKGAWMWRIRYYNNKGEMISDKTVNMSPLLDAKSKYNEQLIGFHYNALAAEYIFIYVGNSMDILHVNRDFVLQRSQNIEPINLGTLPEVLARAETFHFRGNTRAGAAINKPDEQVNNAFDYFTKNFFGKDIDLSTYIFDRGDHQILVIDRPGTKQFQAFRFNKN